MIEINNYYEENKDKLVNVILLLDNNNLIIKYLKKYINYEVTLKILNNTENIIFIYLLKECKIDNELLLKKQMNIII